jgi:hypothetical protein
MWEKFLSLSWEETTTMRPYQNKNFSHIPGIFFKVLTFERKESRFWSSSFCRKHVLVISQAHTEFELSF